MLYSVRFLGEADVVRVVIVFLLLLFPSLAHAHNRVALVTGNSAYQHTPRLANPKNDATDVAAALKAHGFHVIDGFDLGKAAFNAPRCGSSPLRSRALMLDCFSLRARPSGSWAELSRANRCEGRE